MPKKQLKSNNESMNILFTHMKEANIIPAVIDDIMRYILRLEEENTKLKEKASKLVSAIEDGSVPLF